MDLTKLLPPAQNAVELFHHFLKRSPEVTIATFIDEDGRRQALTYGELDAMARRLARDLAPELVPGSRVLVAYDSGPEFLAAVWAALYTGAIAVPVDPVGLGRPATNIARLASVAANSGATTCIASKATLEAVRAHRESQHLARDLRWIVPSLPEAGASEAPPAPELRAPGADEVALIQYASGSTGAPKGTMVTQADLMRLARALIISSSVESPFGRPEIEVTWLPLTHSTGAYGLLIKSLAGAALPGCYITPVAFARSPVVWLRTISSYRGRQVYSVAPNFALDWCVSSTTPAERKELDLSCWTHFMCMGERVRPETLQAFSEAFRDSSFHPKVFIAGYGLSEAGYVCGSISGSAAPPGVAFDRASMIGGRLSTAATGGVRLLPSSGFSLPGVETVIVDPESREALGPGQIGEVWVSSPNAMAGYWGRPEETERQFRARTADGRGPFIRTGDLGAFHEGHLFVTGRSKNLVVVRGRKHYAEDIESTIEQAYDWLGSNSVIAFADEINGNEELVIVLEPTHACPLDEVVDAARGLVAKEFGIRVHEVLVVGPGQLPRTSIGKVSRVTCRNAYRAGTLNVVGRTSAAKAASPIPPPPQGLRAERAAPTRKARVLDWVQLLLASLLSCPASELSIVKSFSDLGVDSMTGVRFRDEIVRGLAIEVPETAVYNYPSLSELAAYLSDQLGGERPQAPADRADREDRDAVEEIARMSEEQASIALLEHLGAQD